LINPFTYEVLRDDYYGAIYFQLKAHNVGAIGSTFFGRWELGRQSCHVTSSLSRSSPR